MKGIFYLKNFECPANGISISLKDYSISVKNIPHYQGNGTQSYPFNYIDEKSQLEIESLNKTKNLLDLACDIVRLLSFGSGSEVVFDRHIIDGTEFNKEMVKTFNAGIAVIPSHNYKIFLSQTLSDYHIKDESFKKSLMIISKYLNQTKHGFVDDRIMVAMQAWETYLSLHKNSSNLQSSIKNLRREIRLVTDSWLEADQNKKLNNEIKLVERIHSSFSNEVLISKLLKLVKSNHLNYQELGIEFRKAKKYRDQVAHTGFIKNMKGKPEIIKGNVIQLESIVKGLQLIILKRLGYKGEIIDSENGWRTFNNINQYFKVTEHNKP